MNQLTLHSFVFLLCIPGEQELAAASSCTNLQVNFHHLDFLEAKQFKLLAQELHHDDSPDH